MTPTKSNPHIRPLLISSLGFVVATGCLVIIGWHAHLRAFVQVMPGTIPMQYNTALCFIVAGVTAIARVRWPARWFISVIGGGSLAAMGTAVVVEYLIDVPLGIDTLFFYPWDTTLSADPGRMALTTSIGFAIAGAALAICAIYPRALIALAVAHTLPLSFGLTSLLGYLFGVTYVLPFRLGTQMAVHTATAFVIYSGAMIVFACRRMPLNDQGIPRWSPGIAIVMLPVLFIGFSSVIQKDSIISRGGEIFLAVVATIFLGVAIHQLRHARIVYKGVILTAIPLIFTLGFVYLVNEQKSANEAAESLALHSTQVIGKVQLISESLVEAESNIRGFTINSDAGHLRRYEAIDKSLPAELDALLQLVSDNPAQSGAAGDLVATARERMDLFDRQVELLTAGKRKEDLDLSRAGAAIMDRFRSQRDTFLTEERLLNEMRRADLAASWQRFGWLIVAGTSADLLLAFTLAFLFTRGIGKRIRTLMSNAEALADGSRLALPMQGTDEVAELDNRFHRMADALIEARSHLEQKVEDRTLDLSRASRKITKLNKDLQKRVEMLRETNEKLETILSSMSEGLVVLDKAGKIEFVNDRFCVMSGYESHELVGRTTWELVTDEESQRILQESYRKRQKGESSQYELCLPTKSGEMVWLFVGAAPLFDAHGALRGSMAICTDITERKRIEEQLVHDAFHDGLTGMANRALFLDHLQLAIDRSRRHIDDRYAVLFLDYDGFKMVNDSLGHTEGDRILCQIAERLHSTIRPGDLVARLGGDEFTILLNELEDESDAITVTNRIHEDLKSPFHLAGREVFITASIGIAYDRGNEARAQDLLRDADTAMYRAKARGPGQFQVFDSSMHEHALTHLQLQTEMRHALDRGEFVLHYQPIVRLDTGALVGFESLVRWEHPARGLVPPSEFISTAESNGLIVPLGRWILEESCRQLRRWQNEDSIDESVTISVNLSCKQLVQSDMDAEVAEILMKTGLDPTCLKLEVTESHVMENSNQAVQAMRRLNALGVEFSLDDFGTGYSSLSYLHRLPARFLKIDRSFVNRMNESEENREIVSTIVKLARNLRMNVVAEGIETKEQLNALRMLGCDFGQGYYFARPLPPEIAVKSIRTEDPTVRCDTPDELNLIG